MYDTHLIFPLKIKVTSFIGIGMDLGNPAITYAKVLISSYTLKQISVLQIITFLSTNEIIIL